MKTLHDRKTDPLGRDGISSWSFTQITCVCVFLGTPREAIFYWNLRNPKEKELVDYSALY